MMRKIVFPTDFSANAFNALQYAVELFKYEKCEIFLVHAYAAEVYSDESDLSETAIAKLKSKIRKRTETSLKEVYEKIREISPNPKHHYRQIAVFSDLVDAVNDLVNSENADVCIMGTRGKTNDKTLSFGSNTLMVLKYVQCPVLSIPADYAYKTPEEILFPTNFLVPYQKRELKLVSELARVFGAKITFFYIAKYPLNSFRQRDNQRFLKEQFQSISCSTQLVNHYDKATAITNYCSKNNIDLLVMVNSRQSELEELLYERTIDKISLNPKIPFLVLQNYSRESV